MTNICLTPIAICDFSELVVKDRESSITFCRQLESPDYPARELCERIKIYLDEDLAKFCESGSMGREILYELGRVSGATGNLMGKSNHGRVIQLRLSLRSRLQNSSFLDWLIASCEPGGDNEYRDSTRQNARRQLAEIGREYREELEKITQEMLEAEAEAACRRWEGQQHGDDRGGGPEQQEPESEKSKVQNSTPGSADQKILSALCKHHKYDECSCAWMDPIGGNELARLAGVGGGSVTSFWKRRLNTDDRDGTYEDYRRACVNGTLPFKLALWRGEAPTGHALQLIEDRIAEQLNKDDD